MVEWTKTTPTSVDDVVGLDTVGSITGFYMSSSGDLAVVHGVDEAEERSKSLVGETKESVTVFVSGRTKSSTECLRELLGVEL